MVGCSVTCCGFFTAYRSRSDEASDYFPYTYHPYAYVLSNPINWIDPTGKCANWAAPDCDPTANPAQWDWEAACNYYKAIVGAAPDAPYCGVGEIGKNSPTNPLWAYRQAEAAMELAANVGQSLGQSFRESGVGGVVERAGEMAWSGITSPWESFIEGWNCNDSYLLGRGVMGIGNQVLTVAGVAKGLKGSEVRYKGRPVSPMEVTYEMRLNPDLFIQAVVEKYGINLRGSGRTITVKFNPNLASEGMSRKATPDVIEVGPRAFASEATLANTIAHELNHARSWLAGGNAPEKPAYNAGDSLEDYIGGGR